METNLLLEGVTSTERDRQLGTIPMEARGKVGDSETRSLINWQTKQQILGF